MPFDIRRGGRGEQADVDLVAAELAAVPEAIAAELVRRRIAIVACRDAVTDFASELADQHPDGWPDWARWTMVPGAYIPARRSVVIATRGPDAGGPRRVPRFGEGHGARSLAVHETVHGYDNASSDLRSADPAFRRAWTADKGLLGSPYFTGDQYGPRETYAESAAKAFALDASERDLWPTLKAFWAAFRPFSPGPMMRLGRALGFLGQRREPEPLGRAWIDDEGRLQMDLTAHAPGGAVGHARLTLEPGDPQYDAFLPGRRPAANEPFLVWPRPGAP